MPALRNLLARSNVVNIEDDSEQDSSYNEDTIRMMVGVLSLVIFGLLLATTLLYFRRVKQQRKMMELGAPPAYSDARHHPGLTIQTTDKHGRSSVFVISKDGQPMLSNPMSPPHSPDNVPQIRITFPDEQDDAGKTKSGRVVVVRMGETSVGLEPVREEPLPVYEKENSSQFYSIDMDKIGGLKEKDRNQFC
ncbi:hypothetical protein jhhlp_004626 [Lomentospora prolificans]|uniref:Uncharacterized protein n=1 Tax=Lomentospora prolificans TaxID=41688 RepID=A0A2N3NCB7_9PEZI|nr:hypothetical protein jhhlp_004626 [Lomentospora prolificans]